MKIALESWSKLSETKSFYDDVPASVFAEKKEAYNDLASGDYSKAYYDFSDLKERYPRDYDIQKYYAQAKEKLSVEFSTSDIKDDVFVLVIANYTTTDGEKGMIAYNPVEPSSNTYILIIIIVLAVLIVLAIGGFFIIKLLGKRRMKKDLLSLGGGIGEKIDFKDDAKEINLVEQGSSEA